MQHELRMVRYSVLLDYIGTGDLLASVVEGTSYSTIEYNNNHLHIICITLASIAPPHHHIMRAYSIQPFKPSSYIGDGMKHTSHKHGVLHTTRILYIYIYIYIDTHKVIDIL